jgi:3-deoxy-manno-octulosonate cytidylyltransferase (CMP-KDO synthetase)
MIEHVYRRAARGRGVDAVVVATDDERIAKAVERFGGIVRMTSAVHRTGTDRIAEIARELSCDVVVNVQGDLPLVEPDMIAQVVEPLLSDPAARMSTVYRRVTTMAEYMSLHVVKVVVDRTGHALYFSRAPIPAGPAEAGRCDPLGSSAVVSGLSRTNVFKHIGMYGYRRDFLLTFAALPQTPLEQAESLEQLRALEHGFRIRAVETDFESIEIDTPEDLERVRQLVTERAATPATTSSTNTRQGEVA